MPIINYQSPKITILFTSVDGDEFDLSNQSIEGVIKSVTTTKFLRENYGTFSIEVIAKHDFKSLLKAINRNSVLKEVSAYSIFRANTLVDIYINDKEIMLGKVESCSKGTSVSNEGKPETSYTITGFDLGSLLTQHKIWYDKNPAKVGRDDFILAKGAAFLSNIKETEPYKIIESVFTKWFSDVLNNTVTDASTGETIGEFKWSDDQGLLDKITCDDLNGLSKYSYNDFYAAAFDAWNYEGDILQFLKSFINPPFAELYTDTGDCEVTLQTSSSKNEIKRLKEKKIHVIFRPTPYDDSQIGEISSDLTGLIQIHDLPTHYIDDSSIVNKNLTMSRNNIYSVYIVHPMAGIIPTTQSGFLEPPEYDALALKRYGHNLLEVQLESFDPIKDGTGNVTNYSKTVKALQKKLRSWYGNSDKYLVGQFVLKGDENIRVGQKLVYGIDNLDIDIPIEDPFERGYYYTVGVTQEYVYGEKFSTTVSVDRGTSLEMQKLMKESMGI